jgi:hypothetical protein
VHTAERVVATETERQRDHSPVGLEDQRRQPAPQRGSRISRGDQEALGVGAQVLLGDEVNLNRDVVNDAQSHRLEERKAELGRVRHGGVEIDTGAVGLERVDLHKGSAVLSCSLEHELELVSVVHRQRRDEGERNTRVAHRRQARRHLSERPSIAPHPIVRLGAAIERDGKDIDEARKLREPPFSEQ